MAAGMFANGQYTPAQVAQLFVWYGLDPLAGANPGENAAQRYQRLAHDLNSGARTWSEIANSIGQIPGANKNPAAPDPGPDPLGRYKNPPGTPTPPPTTTPGTPPGTAPPPDPAASNDAFAFIMGVLKQYGLEDLAPWAMDQLKQNRSPNQIVLDLYQQPAFKARFPAIDLRVQAGLPPISPAEYIAYEQQARQMMMAAGLPPGMFDAPDDFTKYIANDTSVAELSQRVSLYQQAAYQVPVETRQFLAQQYGVSEGDLAAYFMDDTKALPYLQQKEKAAEVGGAATIQHFGITGSEAERLASLGVTSDQAMQGFGTVYNAQELFQQLPGEVGGQPTRADALGFVAGDAAASQKIQTQARRRISPFQAGGGYATSQTGVTGLGSANTN